MKIIFLGPPGSGKGTLAKMLVEKLNFQHIAAGDLLREEVFKKTDLGKEINLYLSEGLLVPDKIIVQLIKNKISSNSRESTDLVLDGFPRSLEQAQALEKMLEELKTRIDGIIYFKISQEGAIKRLSGRLSCPNCGAVYHKENLPPKVAGKCDLCGSSLIVRDDDQPQTIKSRYQVYENQTRPLIEYYSRGGKLFVLEAASDVGEIFQKLLKILEPLKSDDYH
jgi:adenylate kinase